MAFSFGGGPNFGGSAAPAATPGPSFGLPNHTASVAPQQQPGDIIVVPTFNEILPARSIWYKVDSLLRVISSSSSNSVAGTNNEIDDAFKATSELIQLLKDRESPNGCAQRLLLQDRTNSILEKVSPDICFRQRLHQRGVVSLSIEQHDGSVVQQEATITPSMLNDICMIADDLMVPEIVAISLYQQAVSSETPFQSTFVQNILKNSTVTPETTSVPWMAREIYYSQSPMMLHSCLSLLQNRLRENSRKSSLNPITEATDHLLQAGLITNLIDLVLAYTQRIDTLLVENSEGRSRPENFVVPSSSPAPSETSAHFWRNEVALQACFCERQRAVECLYFIAYSTQLQGPEVVALMDLLRQITDHCIILDPYTDVPDPMEVIPGHSATSTLNFTAPWLTPQPQREKDTLVWERELVTTAMQTGQPQLLRCGCTILVTIFSALSDKALLMDRMTHVPNGIGIGNALFPPGSTSIGGLEAVQKYLTRDAIATWKRPDVLGLVMASYSMLLQSSKESSVDATSAIVQSFRECVTISLELKSFSFARLSLIPALRLRETIFNDYANDMVAISCNVTEFFLASIADFAAQYMDVFSTLDEPLQSRAQWEQDAEADLKARREQQELDQSLRGTFQKWSDPAAVGNSEDGIPTQVDLLVRPDCIDDVIAFSIEIGIVGPEYAIQFWSQASIPSDIDEGVVSTKLIPSRAVTWLEQQQRNDESLRPVYISFLAALALAKNPSQSSIGSGADEVFGLISAECDVVSGWATLIEMFRWYIRQLSPDNLSTRTPSTSASSTAGSTSYYYLHQDGNSETESMFGTERSNNYETVSQSRPRELGDANEFILLSNLLILTNVTAFSTSARSTIVNIHLPVVESDGETVGQESVLSILFMLAVMPISPDIRGSVFDAIAALLSNEGLNKEEQENMRSAAIKGWEILEEYQILPISLLQQYPSTHDPSYHGAPTMSFPPSSSALAISKNVPIWIQPDPRYAIMYEMEFVESRRGHYPSTMGFLNLLSSLFTVGGFPSTLGQNWRPQRTGCAPYIEYITDYVLPRVTGKLEHFPPLPFRTIQEKSLMTTAALDVLGIVLSRYHVVATKPMLDRPEEALLDDILKESEVSATRALVLRKLVLAVIVRPHAQDVSHFVNDYSSTGSTRAKALTSQENAGATASQQSTFVNLPIAPSKSTGYSILAGMLNSKRHTLFDSVTSPLVERDRVQSKQHDTDVLSLVFALYVSTPPTFTSAKDGARRSWPVNARQLLLASLRPNPFVKEQSCSKEREISSVLRLLCGIAAREESFLSLTRQATHIPVLRFSKKSSLPTTIDLQLSKKLSILLISSEMKTGIVSSIVDEIGIVSKNKQAMTDIATMATAISFYIERSVSRQQALELLSFRNPFQVNGGLVSAITTRFTLAAATTLLECDAVLLVFILERLLTDLRTSAHYGAFAEVMFGEKVAHQQSSYLFLCVDAILRLLENVDFLFGEFSAEVATLCFETFYRLIAIGNGNHGVEIALVIAEHLRARDFWTLGIFKLCSTALSRSVEEINVNKHFIVHSIAWLLKGVACEFQILSGTSKEYNIAPGLERLIASHPNMLKQLIDVVFADQGLVEFALSVLPIERPTFSAISEAPSDEKCVIDAKHGICGAPEVVYGYNILNFETLHNGLKAKKYPCNEIELRSWVEQWNHSVHADCSSAHLSDAIRRVIEASLACGYHHRVEFTSGRIVGETTMFQLISRLSPVEDHTKNIESIDATYFTTACRNIASSARILSLAIGEQWRESADSDDNFWKLPNLIVRVIACSVADSRSYAEFVRIKERIAALAGALLPIVRARRNQYLVHGDAEGFWFQAAVTVAQLCTNGYHKYQKTTPIAPSHDDVIMQTCLYQILENLTCPDGNKGVSSCRDILTYHNVSCQTTPIRGMIEQIKSFDEGVALLAQRLISNSQEIGELFISSGIFEALQHAADVFCLEEKKFLALLASNVNYTAAQIKVPTYLVGHFEILSTIMISHVPPSQLRGSLLKIVAILSTYKNLFERLVNDFPVGGDSLYAMMRCITQANTLRIEKSQLQTFAITEIESSMLTNASTDFTCFLGPVSKLIMHIAENPLPSRMLAPIPSRLTPQLQSGLVTQIELNSLSWWDKQEEQLDAICNIATLGMDLVRFGVLLMHHSASLSTADEFSLSRSLCRCITAARYIETELRSSSERKISFQTQQQTALTTLRSKIIDSLESILVLTVKYVRDQVRANDKTRLESCRRTIGFALDHASIGNLNVSPNLFNGEGENRLCIVSDLTCELRRLLDQRSILQF